MLFADSDLVEVIKVIAAMITAVGVPWVAVMLLRQQVAAEQVKKTLHDSTARTDVKLDGLGKVADATHVLVNNNMAIQLKLNAVLARRMAEMTKTQTDVAAADLADRLLAEHEAKQAVVDAQHGPAGPLALPGGGKEIASVTVSMKGGT